MFRKLIALFMLLVFSCGFSILAYPVIHKIVTGREMEGQVTAFMEQREAMPTTPMLEEADEPEKEYAVLWDEMVAYNQRLLEEGQPGLSEPGFYVKPAFFLREYGVEDEVFRSFKIRGTYMIPKECIIDYVLSPHYQNYRDHLKVWV